LKLIRPDLSFGRDAIQRLVQCAWPGNIRQLENTIQNAAILARRSVIGADDIRLQSTAIPRDATVLQRPGRCRRQRQYGVSAQVILRRIEALARSVENSVGDRGIHSAIRARNQHARR
jgi:DNA-binding NtrC family response regulator